MPLDNAPAAKKEPVADGTLASSSKITKVGDTGPDQKKNEEQRAGSGCRAVSSSNETFGAKAQ